MVCPGLNPFKCSHNNDPFQGKLCPKLFHPFIENKVRKERSDVCMHVFNDRERTACPKNTVLGRK